MSSPNSLPVNLPLPDVDAWILGSGIPSLAAAVYLIDEAKIPPTRVHILEDLSKAVDSTAHAGDPVNGYKYLAGVTPTCDLFCFEELLSKVTSRLRADKTAFDDILESNKGESLDARPYTQLWTEKSRGISYINPKQMKAGLRHRLDLLVLSIKSEKSLGRSRVCDHFRGSFFRSEYRLVLATT
ncbi:hypothetical protein PoHVEF18_003807 [Penicillium ochrochloron]